MTTYSNSLEKWIDEHLVDPETNTYKVDNFVFVNNGVIRDGTNAANNLQGGSLGDLLWGNGGNDQLWGYAGDDYLNGGAGNDLLKGGTGNDRLEGWGNNDRIDGEAGNDALFGGTGSDQLYGGVGDDYLCGGSNQDQLWGGGGADVFVFRPDIGAARSTSTYMDYNVNQDTLRIEDYLVPNGFDKSMIKVEADGDLYISVANGHKMVFETLNRSHIDALFESIEII